MKAITFDFYGTLARFHEAVEATLTGIIAEQGLGVDMQVLRAAFRATQPAMQAGPYRPYKQMLAAGLEQAMRGMGLPWRPEHGARLVDAIAEAGPFAEVPGVLARLQERWPLVLISNTDNDMIARNLRHFPLRFDHVVTAEAAGFYKPDPRIFAFAFAQAGVRPDEVVHVAAGFHHDIEPGHALGLRRIWINRRAETGDPAFGPYGELPDLSGLPAMLGVA